MCWCVETECDLIVKHVFLTAILDYKPLSFTAQQSSRTYCIRKVCVPESQFQVELGLNSLYFHCCSYHKFWSHHWGRNNFSNLYYSYIAWALSSYDWVICDSSFPGLIRAYSNRFLNLWNPGFLSITAIPEPLSLHFPQKLFCSSDAYCHHVPLNFSMICWATVISTRLTPLPAKRMLKNKQPKSKRRDSRHDKEWSTLLAQDSSV